ncbi:MAG: hypothetical protein JWO63_1122 [Frankiales bacterium]|nr:hypothetical protein [Frankiales bacterium]
MSQAKSRLIGAAVGATVLATVCQLTGLSPAAAAPPGVSATPASPASPASPSESVIVVLRDQLPSTPPDSAHVSARRSQATSDQNSVLSALSGAKPTKLTHYAVANAFSATLTSAQAAQLAANPAVAAVVPNTTVTPTSPATAPASTAPTPNVATPSPGSTNAAGTCPTNPAKPLLEPEALTDTNTASDNPKAKTAQQLVTGAGVKVAYIADGIDPDSPDFVRPNGQKVIIDYKAFSADGPAPEDGGAEAFGDASSIAAQGLVSHDLSTFVNPAYKLPKGCNIRILGMSPGASIIALKSDLFTSSILQAIDYAVTVDHTDVLNESFGGDPTPDRSSRDAISLFNDMAVKAGVTVTVSSGDAGVTNTVGSPATDPNVISVGATTTSRGYAQTGYGAFKFSNGKWLNDEISSLSSAGITNSGTTIDLSAPGEAGWAVCEVSSPECANYNGGTSDIQLFGGTSQSAPLTAGAAALVIQAYRKTHGGASPSPSLVKTLLTSTAKDLGLPAQEQGAGLLDSRAAVEAALTYPGATASAPAGVSSNITLSTNQLDLAANPGASTTSTVTVRNVGTKPVTVSAGTRSYVTIAQSTKTTTINAKSGPTFPYATTGAPWVYKKVTFTVPAGTDRLSAAMIWNGAARLVSGSPVTPVVRLTVLAPDGTYVANSRPQGASVSANYANLDVRQPAAGTWTAILYTLGGPSGYTGAVALQTTSERAVPRGSVSPALLHLNPGQAKPVTVRLAVPSSGGDTAEAITFATSSGHQTSVPAVLRAIVPTSSGTGTFTGQIVGGNARGSASGSYAYAFDVPTGRADLSVGVKLADDPGDLLAGYLVDPNGETQSIGTNAQFDADGDITGQGLGLQLTAATPIPGRWRVIIVLQTPVTGNQFVQGFTGKIQFNRSLVRTKGLPASSKTVLKAGRAVTATVRVTNTGIAPINVQTDARTSSLSTVQLAPLFGSSTVDLLDPTTEPSYLVPPGTRKLTVAASSSLPAQVELSNYSGGIDVVGDLKSAQHGSTLSTASVSEQSDTVGQGFWFTNVEEIGAFGVEGAPPGTANLVASVLTPGFDQAVTSSTGDPYLIGFDLTADLGTPVIIAPGKSATVTIKIVPKGAKGSVVKGSLNIVTPQYGVGAVVTSGDVLATIPYSYKIG